MIRLSIPVREALARLTLPVLIVAAFALMLLGKADALLAERARMALSDLLAPVYRAVGAPVAHLRATVVDAQDLVALRAEDARLRTENARLRQWQDVALALEAENATLKRSLHWVPDPAPGFVTARVVADAGGLYARSVLVALDPLRPAVAPGQVTAGQVALDGSGLAGRVTEVGARSARILLITDMNSRVPVTLEGSHARAILAGTNGPRPRLLYWTDGTKPAEGERVVTSAEAGAFPAGLPVGTVRYKGGTPEVEPFARLDRLEVVRIFDYGLHGLLPPEAGRAAPRAADRPR